jgi:DNA-binding PadR family transcriptional regulator
MPRSPNTSPQTVRVLGLLLQEPEGWHYGYDLSRRTALKSGTLYPILLRLSEQGWLETRWEEPEHPGRPPRHIYRLTAEGVREARSTLQRAEQRRLTLRPEAKGAR